MTVSWSQQNSSVIWSPRSYLSCTQFVGSLFVLGGCGDRFVCPSDVWVFTAGARICVCPRLCALCCAYRDVWGMYTSWCDTRACVVCSACVFSVFVCVWMDLDGRVCRRVVEQDDCSRLDRTQVNRAGGVHLAAVPCWRRQWGQQSHIQRCVGDVRWRCGGCCCKSLCSFPVWTISCIVATTVVSLVDVVERTWCRRFRLRVVVFITPLSLCVLGAAVLWKELTPATGAGFSSRAGACLLSYNNRLWLLGGFTSNAGELSTLRDVWLSEVPSERTSRLATRRISVCSTKGPPSVSLFVRVSAAPFSPTLHTT